MNSKEITQIIVEKLCDIALDYKRTNNGEVQILFNDNTVFNIKVVDLTDYEYNFVNIKNRQEVTRNKILDIADSDNNKA